MVTIHPKEFLPKIECHTVNFLHILFLDEDVFLQVGQVVFPRYPGNYDSVLNFVQIFFQHFEKIINAGKFWFYRLQR